MKPTHRSTVMTGDMGKKAPHSRPRITPRQPRAQQANRAHRDRFLLGEGFDSPARDPLFLAFLLLFNGRIVQYGGRVPRAHDDT